MMVTAMLTFTTKTFTTKSFNYGWVNFKDYKDDAFNAAAAGSCMLCIINYCLIIFVGLGAAQAIQQPTFSNVAMQPVPNVDPKFAPANF